MLLSQRLLMGPLRKEAVWTDYLFDNANTNYRSFTGVNIGDPAADRILVFSTFGTSSGATYTSVLTINGTISATKQFEVTTAANSARLSVWTAAVPSGTTCTIDTTQVSPGAGYESIQVFAVYGISSGTPVATDTSTASPSNLSASVQSGDIAIAISEGGRSASPVSMTWTGLTERSDKENLDYSVYYKCSSSAYDKQTSTGTLNVTSTISAGSINGSVLGVWR